LYIDDETFKKVEKAAKREGSSISKWVRSRITRDLIKSGGAWPKEWLALLGSLKGSGIKRPAQPEFKNDVRRNSL